MDFRFAHPEYLLGLLLMPLLYYLFFIALKNKKKNLAIFRIPFAEKQASIAQRLVYLFLTAIFFMNIALADPQMGQETRSAIAKTNDVLVALDVSNSMLAQDQAPNRLTAAKLFAQDLIKGIRSERIGSLIFAGDAYLQMPLSHDYSAANMFVNTASTDMIDAQGTAMSAVIKLAQKVFQHSEDQQKILVIISDGEDHDPAAIQALRDWNDSGLIIYTVGVGTEDGAAIPVRTSRQSAYKLDKEGNIVKSKLNPKVLKELAAETQGGYFHISGRDQIIDQIKNHLATMEGRRVDDISFQVSRSYYPLFLAVGLLFSLVYIYGYRTW